MISRKAFWGRARYTQQNILKLGSRFSDKAYGNNVLDSLAHTTGKWIPNIVWHLYRTKAMPGSPKTNKCLVLYAFSYTVTIFTQNSAHALINAHHTFCHEFSTKPRYLRPAYLTSFPSNILTPCSWCSTAQKHRMYVIILTNLYHFFFLLSYIVPNCHQYALLIVAHLSSQTWQRDMRCVTAWNVILHCFL